MYEEQLRIREVSKEAMRLQNIILEATNGKGNISPSDEQKKEIEALCKGLNEKQDYYTFDASSNLKILSEKANQTAHDVNTFVQQEIYSKLQKEMYERMANHNIFKRCIEEDGRLKEKINARMSKG